MFITFMLINVLTEYHVFNCYYGVNVREARAFLVFILHAKKPKQL